MKRVFTATIAILLLVSMLAGCGAPADAPETTATEAPEMYVETTFISGGASEYVIVHDGTSGASGLANTIRNQISKNYGVILNVTPAAAGQNAKEIVVGNCRELANKTAKKLQGPHDFAVKVEENALVLCGTDTLAYQYLGEYLSRDVLVKNDAGILKLNSDDNILFTDSSLMEMNYIDYMAADGKGFDLEEIFAWETYENADTKLPYRIYIPFNYSPDKEYPLLVNLHGAGLRGNDNSRHLAFIDKTMQLEGVGLDDAIIIFPQCPEGQKWVDSDWSVGSYSLDATPESNELAAVVELVHQLRETYNVDDNRIYACGFSMGGYATWNLLMNHGDLFCAGIPMCGAGDPTKAKDLVDIPIWAIHGAKDPTVPVVGSRNMVEAIQAAGGEKLHYTELPDNEHDVWNYTYANSEIFSWLLSQSK